MLNILIVGNGGREHALAWKAAQSLLAGRIFVAPGNAGTALENKLENIDISSSDIEGLKNFALSNQVGLTIVGPEAPLVDGIVDAFSAAGLKCFGPSAAAAQLEGSKSFTKDFLARHAIPTADYASFTDIPAAFEYLESQTLPIVIKADGLAAGKGVIIAETLEQARSTVTDMLSGNSFGQAGHRVVIEEFLQGEEASFILMVDGEHVLPMATSQDHKRIGDGDTGLNTGGMGAYSPAPVVDDIVYQRILDQVIYPTVSGMAQEGMPYTGFLYAGLMITADGTPKVIEYNCRFGDPETQPVLLRLKSDLVAHCLAAMENSLHLQKAEWDPRPALGVVMAADGYPGEYATDESIGNLQRLSELNDCKIFHAGTRLNSTGKVVTSGGRVLCATALGNSIAEAQQNAYSLIGQIDWPGGYFRKDIGHRAVTRDV